MIPVSARVLSVKDYKVIALDMTYGPYIDYEIDTVKYGNGRKAALIWIKKTTFPFSIRLHSKNNEPIPIDAEETPIVLDGIEVEKLYVTATAGTGVLYIVLFYPK